MDFLASAKVHGPPRDLFARSRDTLDMDQGGPNHLKAWRHFRQMTQQQVADAIEPPTTKQVIQALESSKMGLSAKWLRRLAPALKTRPGLLLDHAPESLDTEWSDAVEEVPSERRGEAIQILKVLSRR
jgi:transcriptional regulator with XRE-family HTH domain